MSWTVVLAAVAITAALGALLAVGMAAASKGHWGVALGALAGFSVILMCIFIGIEYAQDFWKGR